MALIDFWAAVDVWVLVIGFSGVVGLLALLVAVAGGWSDGR